MQTDYQILSAPRISEATFADVLRGARSPAAPEAATCWTSIVDRGVDPALALAQFAHESGYGRLGVAAETKSWGNIRRGGSFVRYGSWTQGAADYAALISGPLYAGDPQYATARTMPYRWAPASDGNDPAAYGADLVARIEGLIAIDQAHRLWVISRLTATRVADIAAGTVLYADVAMTRPYTTLSHDATLALIAQAGPVSLVADGATLCAVGTAALHVRGGTLSVGR